MRFERKSGKEFLRPPQKAAGENSAASDVVAQVFTQRLERLLLFVVDG